MNVGRHKWRLGGVAAVAAIALTVAGCGGSSSPGSSGGSSAAALKGGTVTWAEAPGSPPNWIWPFVPIQNYSVANSLQFFELMYRPLYYFGDNGTSTLVNYSLSTANAPVWSDGNKTVTINLKGWKWSNGETVDAQDVMFWVNLENAEPSNYGGSSPGLFPQNVTSYSATGPDQVTFHLNAAYANTWYLYNQLSEITPMPAAWDISSTGGAAGSGGCATDSAADKWAKCIAVYNYLDSQAKDSATFATSPIWGVVDGPWKLSSFNAAGNDTFVPNKSYSGSPKPTIGVFKEVPYTDDTTEYTALRTGQVDVGYVPTADLPQRQGSAPVPADNPLGSNYTLAPNYIYLIAYAQPEFDTPSVAYMFRQLYVRQALQETVDQVGVDTAIYRGYAVPTAGVIPTVPANPWTPADELANNGQGPYPFSVANATKLLTSHGWKIINGVATCESAGTGPTDCGANIPVGKTLTITVDYSTGEAAYTSQMEVWKSDASKAGIDLNLVGQSFDSVIGEAAPCPSPPAKIDVVSPKCPSQLLAYGSWVFNGPGFLPTGEPLFASGASSNSGSFSNPEVDNLITQTHTNGSAATMHAYATYTNEQAPYIWLPNAYTVAATVNTLHNVGFSGFANLLPEFWYQTK
jgi:peptide/nickel transport system substrate-binding protein